MPRRRFAPRAAAAAAASAGLLGAAVGVVLLLTPLLSGLEQSTLAARFALRGHGHADGVTIVAIDDRSFAALRQRWPFPRSWHARVLEQLRRAGARAVFYDVQFTEPTTAAQDGALYGALGATGGAVLATTDTDGHGHTNVLGGDANLAAVHSRAAAANLPVDQNGVITRIPFSFDHLPTVATTIFERVNGRFPARSWFAGSGAYIDYQGPPETFPTVSFADVYAGRFDPATVRGRVVVVGATSPTLQDLHATPVNRHDLMSGPEIHANAIWTLLHGVPLRGASGLLSLALVLLAAALAPVIRWRTSMARLAAVAPLAAGAYLVVVQMAFDAGVVLPVFAPLAALISAAVATVVSSHLLVTRELRATQLEIVQRLGRAAESRDGETGRHLERMAFTCERLGLAAGLSRGEARLLRRASALHDIGKIAIPDAVLLKQGAFNQREREVMATHAALGARMLTGSTTSLVQVAETIALTHHERWDGQGYPAGLAGREIPLAGRICAICDVFDALISRRRYKDSWSLEAALAELERGAGTHFDPDLTATFVRIAPRLYRELVVRVDPDVAGRAPTTSVVGPTDADRRDDRRAPMDSPARSDDEPAERPGAYVSAVVTGPERSRAPS